MRIDDIIKKPTSSELLGVVWIVAGLIALALDLKIATAVFLLVATWSLISAIYEQRGEPRRTYVEMSNKNGFLHIKLEENEQGHPNVIARKDGDYYLKCTDGPHAYYTKGDPQDDSGRKSH